MVTSQNLFRQYIGLRSWVVKVVAVFMLLLLIIALVTLLASNPDNINRFGLLMQLFAVLSLVPHIIGKDKFLAFFGRKRTTLPAPEEVIPPDGLPPVSIGPDYLQQKPRPTPAPADSEDFFPLYRSRGLLLVIGNGLASAAMASALAVYVFHLSGNTLPGALIDGGTFSMLLSLLGFAWLNIFMLIHFYLLRHAPVPRGVLAWFFAVDLFVSVAGVFFAGLLHIMVHWLGGGVGFVFHNGARRVVLIMTLPFLISGIFFELLASLL